MTADGTTMGTAVATVLVGFSFLMASNSRKAVGVLSTVVVDRDPVLSRMLFGQLSSSHDVEHRLIVYGMGLIVVGLLIFLAAT